jgi:hypothetical protein
MRRFDITDLHDYYDFNFAIAARAEAIIERILVGQYRAEVPLVYRSEKKPGICRHMMIPTPSDGSVHPVPSLTTRCHCTCVHLSPFGCSRRH